MRRDLSEIGLRLSAQVVLHAWDCTPDGVQPAEEDPTHAAEPAPLARFEIPLERGQTRRFLAMRAAQPDEAGEFDAVSLLDGLPEAGRVRLALYLLEACRTAFRLEGDAAYAANMRLLISELFGSRRPLVPCATVGERLVLLRTKLPSDLGPVSRAIAVGASSVRRIPFAPSVARHEDAGAAANASLLVPAPFAEPGSTIVLVGEGGLAVRQVARRRPMPTVFEYLSRDRADRRADAEFILECLSARRAGEFLSPALVREIGTFAAERGAARAAPCPATLDLRVCVASPAGVFFGGRLVDGHGLIRALEIRGAGFAAEVAMGDLFCLDRSPSGRVDFLALATSPNGPPRNGPFVVMPRLASGAKGNPTPATVPTMGPAAHECILRALPQHAPAELIDRIAGPALFGLAGTPRGPIPTARDVFEFGRASGTADIGASLVVPFGRERDVLHALAGAIAVDPALRGCELIFVLDRATSRRAAELALSFVWTAYGLASRLVVTPGPADRLDLISAGMSVAANDWVVVLDDGLVPDRAGWLQALRDGLHADERVAACGGRILNADGSIWSAGLSLANRSDATLCVTSDRAGMPAADATAAASPPLGISLGFCALRRSAWTMCAGDRTPYLTATWTDLDLCARLRRAGWDIGHAPEATALRVDRTGRPTGLGSENESRIDGWAFARRMAHEAPVHDDGARATEAPTSWSAAA